MLCSVRELTVDYAAAGATAPAAPARLFTYILDDIAALDVHTRPAVIICPGGGYSGTCDREAEPVAVRLNAGMPHLCAAVQLYSEPLSRRAAGVGDRGGGGARPRRRMAH